MICRRLALARTGLPVGAALLLSLHTPLIGPPIGPSPALPPATAVELRGATFFARPPWKADLVAYRTTVGDPRAEYFFSVELDEAAGASLGGLLIRQSEGPQRISPFSIDRTRAFLGRPRGAGQAVPVEADGSGDEVLVRFPEPVPPGSTVTVVLKPWRNPSMEGTYLFQVTAFPDGATPNPTPLGSARLRIYRADWH